MSADNFLDGPLDGHLMDNDQLDDLVALVRANVAWLDDQWKVALAACFGIVHRSPADMEAEELGISLPEPKGTTIQKRQRKGLAFPWTGVATEHLCKLVPADLRSLYVANWLAICAEKRKGFTAAAIRHAANQKAQYEAEQSYKAQPAGAR